MKYFCLLACAFFLFTAQQCKTRNGSTSASMSNLTNAMAMQLQGTWLHSHEDDADDVRTYRPNSYDFPPSRGRTGFAFEADGKFIQYNIAPTDGLKGVEGRWAMVGDRTVKITFPNSTEPAYEMELVQVEKDMLKVRRKY